MPDVRQQINLYQPAFGKPARVFSSAQVAAGLLVVIVALAAFTWNEERQLTALATQAASLHATQLARQAIQPGASAAPAETQEQLDERLKRMEQQVAERNRAFQMLQSGSAGRTTGFAQRLDALARRHVEGVQLDQIVFSGTDGAMSLRGLAIGPDVVSQYLRSLANEPALSGARFDDFLIERPGKNPDELPAPAGSIRFRAASKSLQELAEKAT